VLLAGLAALRVGAGRLQVVTVDTTSVAIAVSLPEAMVSGLPADAHGSISPAAADELLDVLGSAGTVVLGPGLSGDGVLPLLQRLLPRLGDDVTLVLDAVALTALAKAPELLAPLADRTVLTPNSGELAALLDGEQLEERARAPRWSRSTALSSPAAAGWSAPDGRTWREEAGGIGSAPPAPATSSPAWSAGCWPAAPSRRRPPSGGSTCTPRRATGSRRSSAAWASWHASCSTRCRGC
jgi:uncharacterized Zn-binding protein involved in type VI secretion